VVEPMSERLGRLLSAAFWIAITLLVAVLVICLLGSAVGLMVRAPELQSLHGTTQSVWRGGLSQEALFLGHTLQAFGLLLRLVG